MTEPTHMWKGAESIQWGCALMELLGESTLERLPLVLSGTRVAESSYQSQGHATAVRNARRLTGKLPTHRAVQKAVQDLGTRLKEGGTDPSYRIDPRTLAFTPVPGQSARILAAQQQLTRPRVRPRHGLQLAPGGDLVARLRPHTEAVDVPVRLLGLDLPRPRQHDLTRTPDADLRVTLADLRVTAARLDAIDEANKDRWKPENWTARLEGVIHLQRVAAEGLEDTEELDLRGLHHLIGLPGAGKTTLISLLCAHLAEQDKRVAVFFTSIETAREYLERLRRYRTSVAMLVGRSASTHQQHGERLAELIATQGANGFAQTRVGADLFAQTCPLPAFAVNEGEAWELWAPEDAPCESLHLPGKTQPHLCPMWSRCGRVKNQRDLVTASVWLGHVRSADTTVPAHTSPERLQYFELIARTFDLVIFDEVDETQKVLDELGANALDLSGSADSVHTKAQEVTGLSLTGRLAVHDRRQLYPHHYAANNFERHLVRFHEEIDTYERDHRDELGLDFAGRLLTTNFLIREAQRPLGVPCTSARRSAIYAFWDSAMYKAFFRDRRPWGQAAQLAEALDLTSAAAEARWQELVDAFENYLHALTRSADLSEELDVLAGHFAWLLAPEKRQELAPVARLTVAAGFTIAAYQELVRMTRPLAHYGILPQAVRANASADLEQFVPRNLLGTFSSVRYREKEGGRGFDIDYLVLDTAPRLLLHRLHEEGANVLLTSATSWMPDSSSYHVGVPPSYVLRPKQSDQVQLTLRLLPIRHPTRDEPLRFSGAGRHRLENLRHMAAYLAKPGIGGLSPLERAARSMSTPGCRHRKCALVVNSYVQVEQVVRQIARVNPALAERTRGVVRVRPEAPSPSEHYILRGQVEALGHDDDVTVVVFPLTALGRGVNIVFSTDDEDSGAAAIGSVYFLTRPHPVVGDLGLMLSTIARDTELFDRQHLPTSSLAEVGNSYLAQRRALYDRVMRLLSVPLSASRLPDSFLRAFSANLLIPILQTIGRAIRKSSPAEVYFVDAAWAPQSAKGEPDSERSSVLVTMRNLLAGYVTHSDPAQRAVLDALYGPFAAAFEDIEGLTTGGLRTPDDDEDDFYPPTNLEDDGDLDQE
ncbi:hypothetical protein [Deinococcus planocerae]|uniref:pPIWI_RE_Z domain-containing protein n=1 Tax=Deinococcus planocerae TaxID=1737569 RepID=UPI0011AFCCB1|nr:hypothetical protein [Deinococcus planocerae]